MPRKLNYKPCRLSRALGKALRARRQGLELTLMQAETLTGISHSDIGRHERGETGISLGSLESYAKAYMTTPTYLISHGLWSQGDEP